MWASPASRTCGVVLLVAGILFLILGPTPDGQSPIYTMVASRPSPAPSTSASLLHHEVIGDEDLSATPMVMIHGFGANTYTWRHLVRPLAGNRQIVLVDLKGFGKSPKPMDGRYSPLDQADLVIELIQHLGLSSVILVGSSYGGGVALLVALRFLTNDTADLRGLILLDGMAYRQNYPYFIRLLKIPMVGSLITSVTSPAFQVRQILELAYYDDSKITEDQIAAYAEPIRTSEGRHALIETARQILPPDLERITGRFKEISVPTLILWGGEDRIVPIEVAHRLDDDLPNSDLIVLPRVGHLPHEEEPQPILNAISDFLRKNSL
jgi:pimeloyl-ACP methyl ester carboxylesterase